MGRKSCPAPLSPDTAGVRTESARAVSVSQHKRHPDDGTRGQHIFHFRVGIPRI